MMAVIVPTLASIEWASQAAIGTRATTVPTLVPIDTEIKQAARKSPGRIMLAGRMLSARLTVASTAPIALADAANEPSQHVNQSMSIRLLAPAPLLYVSTRFLTGIPPGNSHGINARNHERATVSERLVS